MKRHLFYLTTLLIVACKNAPTRNIPPVDRGLDTLEASSKIHLDANTTIVGNSNKTSELVGIWALGDTVNASFEISKTTFYYPENNQYFKYQLVKDSIKVKYDGFNESFAYKLKGRDTLILNGAYGMQVFKRRK
jgi:hypothetical protein